MRCNYVKIQEADNLDSAPFSPSSPREKWLRRRTHVKLRVMISFTAPPTSLCWSVQIQSINLIESCLWSMSQSQKQLPTHRVFFSRRVLLHLCWLSLLSLKLKIISRDGSLKSFSPVDSHTFTSKSWSQKWHIIRFFLFSFFYRSVCLLSEFQETSQFYQLSNSDESEILTVHKPSVLVCQSDKRNHKALLFCYASFSSAFSFCSSAYYDICWRNRPGLHCGD